MKKKLMKEEKSVYVGQRNKKKKNKKKSERTFKSLDQEKRLGICLCSFVFV